MHKPEISITPLGQVSYRYLFDGLVVYIDPYLSNAVQEQEDERMHRLVEVPLNAGDIHDADYIFITHVHRDHCDEETILALIGGSPQCRIVGPGPVCAKLKEMGVDKDRILPARKNPLNLDSRLTVHPVPAAHPEIEIDEGGGWTAIGYVFDCNGCRFYHAGDTSLRDEIIAAVTGIGSIDKAFLPVNEKNYYKDRQGIVGNMSIREAFYMAEAINAATLVPTHWDMFEINQVFPEEIELLYARLKPNFELNIMPCN